MSQAGANSSAGTGAVPIETLTGNSGGAVPPDGVGNIDVLGNNGVGIDIVGTPGSNLLTVIGLSASETQIGVVELATAAETTTGTSTTLAVHPSGLDTKLGAQTANGLIYGGGGAGSNLAALGEATDGQLPIGDTASAPVLATLTAGPGVSIVNGAGSITISASGTNWNDITGTSSAVVANEGYIANNVGLVTLTIPSTCAVGDSFHFAGLGSGGWRIAQNAGQTIHYGSSDTTPGVGGRLDSTNRYDSIELLCVITNTDFVVLNSIGNITVT